MIKTQGGRTWKRSAYGRPTGRLAVLCPVCGAKPGEMCFKIRRKLDYRVTLKTFHRDRSIR